jgi:hypothetical protein
MRNSGQYLDFKKQFRNGIFVVNLNLFDDALSNSEYAASNDLMIAWKKPIKNMLSLTAHLLIGSNQVPTQYEYK